MPELRALSPTELLSSTLYGDFNNWVHSHIREKCLSAASFPFVSLLISEWFPPGRVPWKFYIGGFYINLSRKSRVC
jgi:hypothetical protein